MDLLLNSAIVEAGVIGLIVALVMEALKHAVLPNDKIARILPLISMLIGILIGLLYAFNVGADLMVYGLAGLIGGGFASGIYDTIKSTYKRGV